MASTPRLTHYAIQAKRGTEATTAIGILPGYRGVSVHDGWKPYPAQTTCRHSLCNVHHRRELTFIEEPCQQPWAKDLKDLLRAMRAATEQARAHGQTRLLTPERDLRMLKTQHKVSGCFRSDAGGEAFARLRSYLSTLRKQGVALLGALQTLFTARPLYPALG